MAVSKPFEKALADFVDKGRCAVYLPKIMVGQAFASYDAKGRHGGGIQSGRR